MSRRVSIRVGPIVEGGSLAKAASWTPEKANVSFSNGRTFVVAGKRDPSGMEESPTKMRRTCPSVAVSSSPGSAASYDLSSPASTCAWDGAGAAARDFEHTTFEEYVTGAMQNKDYVEKLAVMANKWEVDLADAKYVDKLKADLAKYVDKLKADLAEWVVDAMVFVSYEIKEQPEVSDWHAAVVENGEAAKRLSERFGAFLKSMAGLCGQGEQ